MIEAHGGDPRVTQDTGLLPQAPHVRVVTATTPGWIWGIDARMIGELVIDLGGGRRRADETIDPRVGMAFSAFRGQRVEAGQPLAELHLSSEQRLDVFEERLRRSFRIRERRPKGRRLIVERVAGSP
jgi:thymidine phosphorylase